MERDPVAVLRVVVDALEDLGLRYAVGGSVASSLYGEPRSTQDVDLLVALPDSTLRELADRLRASFYIPEAAAAQAIAAHSCFNLLHRETGFKVDLFVAGPSALDVMQLERVRTVALTPGGRPLRVTSPAVLVLRKLQWLRAGGGVSERQWRDVLGILRTQGAGLDRAELARDAAGLGLADLLRRAVAEVDGSPPAAG